MKDYTGIKTNKLTAISFVKRENKKTYWLFKCDCGNEKVLSQTNVFGKGIKTKSCGCIPTGVKRNVHKTKTSKFIDNIEATKKDIYRRYKMSAKKRKYIFSLTYTEFIDLIIKNCFYCNSEPNRISKLKSNGNSYPDFICHGVDRKDNNKGYEKENCVTCCTFCNRAKNNVEYNVFINWINQIKNNHGNSIIF